MKRAAGIVAALALLLGRVGQTKADIILGPPVLGQNESGHSNHGLDFTALTNSLLEGFVFHNQGNADTITLTSGGVTLHTLSVSAGNPLFVVSNLNWDLTAGTEYQLLGTTTDNGKFTFISSGGFPVSDADIRVNAGVFSSRLDTSSWADFTGIATGPATVPEPASLTLLGIGVAGLMGYAWRRRCHHAA